jgi:hypothetical protein
MRVPLNRLGNITRHSTPLLLLPARRFSFRGPLLLHAPRRRGSSGFRGIHAHSNGMFYAEHRARGFRLTLGMYDT